MDNDLISRNALIQHAYSAVVDGVEKDIIDLSDVDNAPTVSQINIFCENADEKAIADMKEELQKVIDDLRPQGKFVEMLKDRILKSVCKYCQMNKHCELCEISRVFSIIALTDKEMKEGTEE